MPARPFRLSPAVAASALAMTVAGSADAAVYTPDGTECRRSATSAPFAGPALQDGQAYRFGVAHGGIWSFDGTLRYAVLDGGGNAASGPAYEGWGDLFVGSTQSDATKYYDGDRLGCAPTADGDGVAFRPVQKGDLQVRRTIFASETQGSGARLVQSIENTGAEPVTTSVFVGDLRADDAAGRLASGTDTRVTATSSTPEPAAGSNGPVVAAGDRWAVTTDGKGTLVAGSSPAIAHVWDGPGGQTSATLARSGTEAGAAAINSGDQAVLAKAQLGYAWQNVTVAPGETASFLSWSAQRAAVTPELEATSARNAAEEISRAESGETFEGMNAEEIASVRNWAKPAPSIAIDPVEGATTSADVSLRATDLHFAPSDLPVCDSGSVRWTFPDGSTTTDLTTTRRFPAGATTVQLTVTNICGGSRTEQRSFAVAGPGPAVTPTPVPTPTPTPAPTDESQSVMPEGVGGPEAGATPTPAVVPTPAPTLPLPTPIAPTAPVGPSGDATPAAPSAGEPLSFFAVDRMRMTTMVGKGVATSVVSTVPGDLRVVLSGGGLKLVKTMTLAPGVPRTPTFKLAAKDLPALRRAKSLQVRAKLTTAGGQEIIVSRSVAVRK